MSSLHSGDDGLHYSDHSHRWIAPAEVEQELWEAELATHLEQHRTSMGRPAAAYERGKCRTRRVPAKPLVPVGVVPLRRLRLDAVAGGR